MAPGETHHREVVAVGMKRQAIAVVLALLVALSGTQVAAASWSDPSPVASSMAREWVQAPAYLEAYGEPVSDEVLAEVDGEWATFVIGGAYGALGGAVNYTVASYGNDWSWGGLAGATVSGAVGGAVGSLFGSSFLSVTAGSISGGLISRWW